MSVAVAGVSTVQFVGLLVVIACAVAGAAAILDLDVRIPRRRRPYVAASRT